MRNKINSEEKLFVTGHRGMVGSKLVSKLLKSGYSNVLTADRSVLDLKDQGAVGSFFKKNKPKYVIHIAAKVGGIAANISNPATFLYDNLMMQANVINASYEHGVEKFLFLGSSCIYPKDCPQPMKEDYLLTGKLEPTNEGYAIGKIAGIKLLEGYYKQYGFKSVSLMPCNLYGPNDSFDLKHAHVLSSLVKKFVDGKKNGEKSIELWGTGIARREFMYVDDLVDAIIYFFEQYDHLDFINIGTGKDISILNLANLIKDKVGFDGEIHWDPSRPDGMLRKCLDVTKMIEAGFIPKTNFEDGIEAVIENYKKKYNI